MTGNFIDFQVWNHYDNDGNGYIEGENSSNDNDIHQMLHIFTTSITHQDLQHVIEKFIQAMQ